MEESRCLLGPVERVLVLSPRNDSGILFYRYSIGFQGELLLDKIFTRWTARQTPCTTYFSFSLFFLYYDSIYTVYGQNDNRNFC